MSQSHASRVRWCNTAHKDKRKILQNSAILTYHVWWNIWEQVCHSGQPDSTNVLTSAVWNLFFFFCNKLLRKRHFS